MKPSKPILVTGATGCIGSVLVERLCEAGYSVRALVRNPDRAAGLGSLANVEIICGDLRQPDSLVGAAEGCSLVYHCAAIIGGMDWTKSYQTNLVGTQAIVGESIRAGVERLIYTSTIGVYGLSKAERITEETPWSKYNQPYFKTKQEAERVVWKSTSQVPLTIARVGDVFGPGQYFWTIDLIEKIKQGLLVPPLDSESGFLNPIYIDNLIDALLLMGIHPAAVSQIFNVVDGFPIRASDYFHRYTEMAGKQKSALPAIVLKGAATFLMGIDRLRGQEPRADPGSINYLLRRGKIYPDKLREMLGWSPIVPQEEAFCRTEAWLRQEGYLESKT